MGGIYPAMQLDSASLHLAHGLRPMETSANIVAYVRAQRNYANLCLRMAHCLRAVYHNPQRKQVFVDIFVSSLYIFHSLNTSLAFCCKRCHNKSCAAS